MNRLELLPIIVLTIVLLSVSLTQVSAAAAPSGYVSYSIQVSSGSKNSSLAVNETVTPSSHEGESLLSLAVRSASTNLTYSHVINSSAMVFPYMPAITNKTVTYNKDSYTVNASIVQKDSSQVTFQGSTYTLTNYAFTATYSSQRSSGSARGNLSALPSGLVYSVSLLSNSTLVTATLTSTSLPLAAGATSQAIQTTSAGVGITVAIAAVALSLGVRSVRSKNGSAAPAKPDHWVD